VGQHSARKGTSDTPGVSRSSSKDAAGADTALLDHPSRSNSHSPLIDLEQELASKTELVETLTEQLERAAEEIDRMQRSGADRRRGGGLPVDLVDDHRQLVADMQRVVQQWEDLQAGFSLGRIEVQITELRDFVGERLTSPYPHSTLMESSESPAVITEPASMVGSRLFRSEGESTAPATGSAWEQLKSQMLGTPENSDSDGSFDTVPAQLEPLPPAPEPIDVNLVDVEQLQAAVFTRDAYIATMLRRLRAVEELSLPNDWSGLTADSPDLAGSLQHMSIRLEETLRIAEVELSLERAQVARAQMQLAAQQELIAKHLKRLGITSIDQLPGLENSGANGTNDRRWARFLGGKKS
jgi:hypothetical protein